MGKVIEFSEAVFVDSDGLIKWKENFTEGAEFMVNTDESWALYKKALSQIEIKMVMGVSGESVSGDGGEL